MSAASRSCLSSSGTIIALQKLRYEPQISILTGMSSKDHRLRDSLAQHWVLISKEAVEEGSCSQAVTRQIMAIGQELTYARERVALLDDAPKSNGSIVPSPVSVANITAQKPSNSECAFSSPCGMTNWLFMRACTLRKYVSGYLFMACLTQRCSIEGITAACRAASSRLLPRWKHSEGL